MTISSSKPRVVGAAAKLSMEKERAALTAAYAGWTAEQIWERNRLEAEVALKFARAGIAVFKRWVSIGDNRVRPDHAEADGQFAVLEGSFLVGGEKCFYPGDNSLSAKQRINCRCISIFEDEDGRDLKSYRTQKSGKKRIDSVLAQF